MFLKNKISLFYDKTFIRFVLVGIVNVIVGATVMFVAYNVFHLSYWVSFSIELYCWKYSKLFFKQIFYVQLSWQQLEINS